MNEKKLTAKQERFCFEIAKGCSQREAYIKAYGKGNYKLETIDVKASKLVLQPNIKARLSKIRDKVMDKVMDKVANKLIPTKEDLIFGLVDIMKECSSFIDTDLVGNKVVPVKARNAAIRAIAELNKMLGYNEPEQVKNEVKFVISGEAEEYGD